MTFKIFIKNFFKIIIACFILFYIAIVVHSKYFAKPIDTTGRIYIMKIAPHPSLDKIEKGIEDFLADNDMRYQIVFQNAQGNPVLSQQIAQQAVNNKAKVIIPITTLCALNAYQAAKEHKIPVVFSGVTDPKSAKLTEDGVKPNPGISGVSDFMPPQKQINFLKQLFEGKNFKRIGTVYNIGEQNTVAQIEEFEKELNKTDFKLTKVSVHQTQDIGPAILKIVELVDFILIFNDNLVVSSMPQILKIAKDQNIPVVSTDPESVELGALASLAYDQYEMGRQTGEMVLKVLNGKKVDTLNIEIAEVLSIYFNENVAKAFNIQKPKTENGINIITK
ncbi:MAG: ABC transporter substrate-binding protein [Proteobacteria bacterium]|nr:ABC transporter substrate-binding protein [Pseudomonadota bacterium]